MDQTGKLGFVMGNDLVILREDGIIDLIHMDTYARRGNHLDLRVVLKARIIRKSGISYSVAPTSWAWDKLLPYADFEYDDED